MFELFDVSPVTFPAYPDTSVALRSMDKAKETVFKPASEEDVLNLSLRDFLNAEQPEETREAAEKMIDILMPKLSDEQREKYTIVKEISAAKPDGEPPAAAVDIEDDSSDDGRARKAENRWLKLDKKIARILRG